MALAQLISVPKTKADFAQFGFANQAHHRDVIRRIGEIKGVFLQEYDAQSVDPSNADAFANFLNNNQTMHLEMDLVMGVASNNLSWVDWSDQAAAAQWVSLHVSEHIKMAELLGVA